MSDKRRHTRHHPCPICDGWDSMDRGKAKRCGGRAALDGESASCTREEYAGQLQANGGNEYWHRLAGACRCGVEHGSRPAPISIGHRKRQQAKPPDEQPRTVVATYPYRDEAGQLLYEVLRYDPKTFRQRRPDGRGGHIPNLDGVRRLLYRLPELLAADLAATVFYSTSEKDVERLLRLGQVATCNSEGDGKWPETCAQHFAGRRVVFLCHNDKSGIAYGEQVAKALQGIAASVKVVRLPGLPEHGDVSDWLDAGNPLEELLRWVAVWPEWLPPASGPDPVARWDAAMRRELSTAAETIAIQQTTTRIATDERDLTKAALVAEHEADSRLGPKSSFVKALARQAASAYEHGTAPRQPFITYRQWLARPAGISVDTVTDRLNKAEEAGALKKKAPPAPFTNVRQETGEVVPGKCLEITLHSDARTYPELVRWLTDLYATVKESQPTQHGGTREPGATVWCERCQQYVKLRLHAVTDCGHRSMPVPDERVTETTWQAAVAVIDLADLRCGQDGSTTLTPEQVEMKERAARLYEPLSVEERERQSALRYRQDASIENQGLYSGQDASTPPPACVECGGPVPGPLYARCGPCLQRIAPPAYAAAGTG